MAFAGIRTVLSPLASLSALQADVFVGLSFAFALTLLVTFALGILSLALALVLPAILREVTESSARLALRAVAVRRSPSVLCSRVIGSRTHLVSSRRCCPCTRDIHKLSSKEGPRLESLRIQQQVRRKLCVRYSIQNNPHTASHLEIFSPEACSYNARSRSYALELCKHVSEKSK